MKNLARTYHEEESFDDIRFYHGTSSELKIETLLPALETGLCREEWRRTLLNKVFFTDSLMSARGYAKKAAQKFGGEPVVYEVLPDGDVWKVNATEYVADSARILSRITD